MAQQAINIGSTANDGTGDTLRDAFDKTNDNFTELYPLLETLVFDTTNTKYRYTGDGGEISDAGAAACWILGGDPPNNKNYIGANDRTPNISPSVTLNEWANDTGFVSGIFVVSVLGGYDNICNSVGSGIICANHSYIKYSAEGHNSIVGGSTSVIAGGRSSLINCTQVEIDSGTAYDFGAASRNCSIGGDYSAILTSQNCHNDGDQSVIVSGSGTSIASGVSYAIVSGSLVSVTAGSYSIVAGANSTVSGGTALVLGTGHTSTHAGVTVIGSDTSTVANFTNHMGFRVRENNDCVTWKQTTGRRTTNATANNALFNVQLSASKTTTMLLKVRVVAQQDGSADGDNSGNYASAAWAADVLVRWDGTNGFMATSATTSGPSTGPTINLTALRDDIGCAAVPRVAVSTGLLRVQVTGHATKDIMFAIEIEAVQTLVS